MEELSVRERYAKKEAEIKEKYADVINEVATLNNVDLGVGYDMLLATCRGGDYTGDIEFDMDELRKDYNELVDISMEAIKGSL